MSEKSFTMSEINERTNLLFMDYVNLYKADKMSFAEYTLIENVIIKIQGLFSEDVNKDE